MPRTGRRLMQLSSVLRVSIMAGLFDFSRSRKRNTGMGDGSSSFSSAKVPSVIDLGNDPNVTDDGEPTPTPMDGVDDAEPTTKLAGRTTEAVAGAFPFDGFRGWNTSGGSAIGAGLNVGLYGNLNVGAPPNVGTGAVARLFGLGPGLLGEIGHGAICLPTRVAVFSEIEPEIVDLPRARDCAYGRSEVMEAMLVRAAGCLNGSAPVAATFLRGLPYAPAPTLPPRFAPNLSEGVLRSARAKAGERWNGEPLGEPAPGVASKSRRPIRDARSLVAWSKSSKTPMNKISKRNLQ